MIAQTGKKELKKKVSKSKVADNPLRKLKIWVLYPYLQTEDPNLQYYYDFSQSLQEYTKVFKELDADWTWQPVTMQDFPEIIAGLKKRSGRKIPLILNLCDGDEVNGTPGVSVISELEKHRLIYTGSDTHYYNITTSKIPMKQAFLDAGVKTAKWEVIRDASASLDGLCEKLGAPLIIKPAVSGGSMGVSVKNVVYTDKELKERVTELSNGYRGWNLLADGLIVEQFITGPEFTTFIVGSSSNPEKCETFCGVERIFHHSLPEEEKFLSFDRLWEIYEEEKPMPGNENFYEYCKAPAALEEKLKKITFDAYKAVGGMGYGRLDIRVDKTSGELYMLEVNAQCGLSEDENYTSIGAILRFSGRSFASVIHSIIEDAFYRRKLHL
jgi:D-alanine-D-alanine ligase